MYVDGTFGRGGHTRAIAAAGGQTLGIDRDDEAVAAAGTFRVVKGRHGDIAELVRAAGWEEVDGVLLDLGVSSPQLDDAARGFSFIRPGPLDMRMDRNDAVSAADIVNRESAERLEEIFREFGEEPQARRIARAVAGRRGFETTEDLASFIERTVGRRGPHHPATRVFQALRMAVNDEIGELERALAGALSLLRPGGRLAVITFESLTDRIVKRFFAAHAGRMVSLQEGGERWEGELPRVRAVSKKAITAGEKELEANPRARSAKLRAVEKKEL
jgi:16S rRNA (cytosine1402-N4)-methyltransferase